MPINAIVKSIFKVLAEEAAFWTVILFAALLLAYKIFGNTSMATAINKQAMVTDELMKANLNFVFFQLPGNIGYCQKHYYRKNKINGVASNFITHVRYIQ